MANLLHMDTSPRGERSHSRGLTRYFIEAWKHSHPEDNITYRDVGRNSVPHVSDNTFLISWLFLIGSLIFLFDGFIELSEGLSIHVLLHISASVLFTIASALFIPKNKNNN